MFYFQDLSFSQYSTHEALLKSCSGAVKGYGAYTWVTTDGIKVLWEDEVFRIYLKMVHIKL